ncbi:Putative protein [Zobellia galactanivorans]|uniref:Uncharacterized protein n=1 Tax=Zobellia galactanivorans (strain DSM 12802 / CCUG 47099 / CIP 106680 / NCIMB 13871 / Dsij) TaxID=63186 RepID=G0LBA8_ZOBGA|nr:Putative protein [Zobellia galactanivorans]
MDNFYGFTSSLKPVLRFQMLAILLITFDKTHIFIDEIPEFCI